MPRKKPPAPAALPPAPAKPRKYFPVKADPSDVDAAGLGFASLLTSPAYAGLRVIEAAQGQSERDQIDVPAMLALLEAKASQAADGDLSRLEKMLATQAVALQSLSTHLIQRGLDQSLMANLEAFVRLGLKAQAQCRATVETLAEIKNPAATTFVRQANVSNGAMQVNNGVVPPARAGNDEKPQNKLSGGSQHELPTDTRATSTASRIDTPLEAVGVQYRTPDA